MKVGLYSIIRGLALVGAGAIGGASLRWAVDSTVGGLLALVAVNTAGSVAIGLVAQRRPAEGWRLALATGFCGGLTTLSSVALYVAVRIEDGRGAQGLGAAALVIVCASAAFVAGRRLAGLR